jgi:hypothetical protein
MPAGDERSGGAENTFPLKRFLQTTALSQWLIFHRSVSTRSYCAYRRPNGFANFRRNTKMGSMGMNAKKKDKRRRHAKERKASKEVTAANAESRAQQPRRAPAPPANR